MGAEIEWHDDPRIKRPGTIRFGPEFKTAATHDPWAGVMSIHDYGNRDCYLFAIAGKVRRPDISDSLCVVRDAGFDWAYEDRNGSKWVYDLKSRLFKRERL